MITDQAYILHKRAYQDSSELIKLITQNHGIIDAIAKGSQRPKSKLKGQLQPFTLTQINLMGKSSLKTLIAAEQTNVLQHCAYKNHVSMLYCNELLTLVRINEHATEVIFEAYQNTVKALQKSTSVRPLLRRFEWLLCCELGYELQLPDGSSGKEFVEFDPVNGLVFGYSKQDQFHCLAETFQLFIDAVNLNGQQLNEISSLMRSVVNHLVQGRKINSRELLKINPI